MNESTCPTAYEFQQMLDGEISDQRLEELGAHLEQCATCNQLLRKIPDDNVRRAFRNYHAIDGSDILIQQAILKAQSIFKARSEGAEQDTVRSALDETLSAEQPTQQFTFLAVPQLPDEIGRLGKYRILGVLGQGGMGLVFRANDPTLARDVALKVLWMAKPISTAVKQRFAREAKALASIDHDNVVPVHSVEEDRGVPFLTMKLLSGQTLSDLLADQGKLCPRETVQIARQVAAALSAAHAKGVIHRDIKPSNIWIEESGKVRLIDFGLALTNDLELTNTGDVLGTPKYMSPEQANGQPVSESSDLFSLGCVMYHCLSGAAPFEADSVVAVLRKIADGDYRELTEVDPGLDGQLVIVVQKLLQVDSAQRFATAEELDTELASIETRLSQPVQPPAPARAKVALPSGSRNGGSRWTWKSLALAALLPLGFIAVAAVVISLKFRDDSTVVLTIDGGLETTKLDMGEDRLTITDPNDGKPIEVSVDHARHQLRFEKEGFAAVGTEYDLSTPDGRRIGIRFEAEQLGTSSVGPAGKVSQREIAEWVLRVGGRLFLADTEVTDSSQITESMPPISAVYLVSLELSDREVSILSGINSPVALFLQNIPITGECMQDISRLNLRILQLYACMNFDPSQLKYLEGHPTLSNLGAEGTDLGDELARVAATLPNLQNLSLANEATSESLRLIGGCKNIVELSTWPTLGIRPFDFKDIVQLPNLKRLYLNYEQFGRQTVEAINRCPLLTSLDIADYDGQGELNIELVGQLQKIEALSITGTDLSYADLKVLGKIPQLRSLVLRYTQLSPEQLPDLATLSNLRSLDLLHVGNSSGDLLSDEQLAELAKLMPKCKIQSQDWSSEQ
ncbi:MAG: protein kinase [Pirellulaceae bacterium]